jgi:Nickel responsive protein SCO4226-like
MKRFIIEREIPGAADLTQGQLAEIAATSNEAVASLGIPYTWVTSYVAGDKLYCVHEADDADVVREHARRGGFPADLVTEVASEFGPHTATGSRYTAQPQRPVTPTGPSASSTPRGAQGPPGAG